MTKSLQAETIHKGTLRGTRYSRGFTLIASLLMLLLLSGIAIGLLMMANTESKVGGTDMQNNIAYHAAEGGIEKMYSDLTAVFQNAQAPTTAEICGVSNTPPSMVGVNWSLYSVAPGSGCGSGAPTTPTANWNTLSGGPEAGLYAQVIPVNMQATASMFGGQEVNMTRTAQVALIPVFQYGVFCEGDCAFFDNPNLNFVGRVHANGDLYLGVMSGYNIVFHDKLEAYGNVVTEFLPNGLSINAGAGADTGNVYIPTISGGCSSTTPLTNCVLKPANTDPATSPYGDGSVIGKGSATAQSGTNYNSTNWTTFSNSTTGNMIINGNYWFQGATTPAGTGAKKLSMPFVGGGVQPYEIIRRPPSGELSSSAVGTSREYNMAQIHVLLADDPSELPGGAGDSNNVRLANVTQNMVNTYTTAGNPNWAVTNPWGITIAAANWGPGLNTGAAGDTSNLYFAAATNAFPSAACSSSSNCNVTTSVADWPYAPATFAGWSATQGLQPQSAPTIFNVNSGTTTIAPAFTLCPTATLPPQNYPFLPANKPALCPANAAAPYLYLSGTWNGTAYSTPFSNTALTTYQSSTWNLIDGYLRVEYKNASGTWVAVTNEWLQLGFARGSSSPTAATPNPINPNAILLLQEPADRATPTAGTYPATVTAMSSTMSAPQCTATSRVSGTNYCTTWASATTPQVLVDSGNTNWEYGLTPTGQSNTSTTATQSLSQFNWYPINFYDAREGEPRDSATHQGNADNSCTTNGVMNAVEIDVGNLQNWLNGTTSGSGTSVDYKAQNGYVLYFSDRRGMLLNPNPTSSHPLNTKSGDSGLEDVVNSGSAAGTPDGLLEPVAANYVTSPEDPNLNGVLDNFGAQNLGLGFYGTVGNAAQNLNSLIISTNPAPDPYNTAANGRIASCGTTGRKNWVSGARHVLKLVDGSLGNVPLSPVSTVVNGVTYWGGFTVSSENPVYIQGDYNSNSTDTFFSGASSTGPGADKTGHSATAVIADAVTLLSNSWSDQNSILGNPANASNSVTQPVGNRTAATTYYRVAVAGGKNLSFPFPTWANSNPDYPFATDGGIGNFLRFLEDWSGSTLNYGGSMVSLYYATYGTGLFKCCTYSVYLPPTRNYIFDSDFTLPEGLPPGTPLFRDVESLSYRQLFNPRTD
jgi:Tfp pilus assembly protein PilX